MRSGGGGETGLPLTLGKLFSQLNCLFCSRLGIEKYWTVVVELVVPQGLDEQDLKSP